MGTVIVINPNEYVIHRSYYSFHLSYTAKCNSTVLYKPNTEGITGLRNSLSKLFISHSATFR